MPLGASTMGQDYGRCADSNTVLTECVLSSLNAAAQAPGQNPPRLPALPGSHQATEPHHLPVGQTRFASQRAQVPAQTHQTYLLRGGESSALGRLNSSSSGSLRQCRQTRTPSEVVAVLVRSTAIVQVLSPALVWRRGGVLERRGGRVLRLCALPVDECERVPSRTGRRCPCPGRARGRGGAGAPRPRGRASAAWGGGVTSTTTGSGGGSGSSVGGGGGGGGSSGCLRPCLREQHNANNGKNRRRQLQPRGRRLS